MEIIEFGSVAQFAIHISIDNFTCYNHTMIVHIYGKIIFYLNLTNQDYFMLFRYNYLTYN